MQNDSQKQQKLCLEKNFLLSTSYLEQFTHRSFLFASLKKIFYVHSHYEDIDI